MSLAPASAKTASSSILRALAAFLRRVSAFRFFFQSSSFFLRSSWVTRLRDRSTCSREGSTRRTFRTTFCLSLTWFRMFLTQREEISEMWRRPSLLSYSSRET